MHARIRILINTLFPLEGGRIKMGVISPGELICSKQRKKKDKEDEVVDKGSNKNSLQDTEKEEK